MIKTSWKKSLVIAGVLTALWNAAVTGAAPCTPARS